MYRQYSSRNPRNRGIKVKHALQICFILAVFFWLIYQVKNSHDKTKELEENDAKGSPGRGSSGGLIKIRRKVFVPLYEETVTENKQHNEAMEEAEISEESRDEHEVEKFDAEIDKEEGKMTDEAQEDVMDSKVMEETSNDGNDRKQENSVDDSVHDRGNKSNHKARDKFNEADDASSAVTHANHTRTTENETEVVAISHQGQENILEQENKDNHTEEAKDGKIKKQLKVDGGEISDDANPSSTTATAINVTSIKTKERHSDSSKKGSSQNNTLSEAPNNLETSNSTTDVTEKNPKLSEQNVSESVPELYHDEGIVTEGTSTEGSNLETVGLQQANNFTLAVENHLSDSNSSGHTESKNSDSNDTGSFTLVRMTISEHSLQDGTNTQKSKTVSDSANSRDRKNLGTDLDTVPPLDTE